jgi:hypothetical protein
MAGVRTLIVVNWLIDRDKEKKYRTGAAKKKASTTRRCVKIISVIRPINHKNCG